MTIDLISVLVFIVGMAMVFTGMHFYSIIKLHREILTPQELDAKGSQEIKLLTFLIYVYQGFLATYLYFILLQGFFCVAKH